MDCRRSVARYSDSRGWRQDVRGGERRTATGALPRGGVLEKLAERVASLPALAAAPDIQLVAEAAGCPLARAGGVFFAAAEYFQTSRIEALARSLTVTDYYDGLAPDRALATIGDAHRRITVATLRAGGRDAAPLDRGLERHRAMADRVLAADAAMNDGGPVTASRATVAASLLADLARQ